MERLQRAADTLSMENRRLRKVSRERRGSRYLRPSGEIDGAVTYVPPAKAGLVLHRTGCAKFELEVSPVFLNP